MVGPVESGIKEEAKIADGVCRLCSVVGVVGGVRKVNILGGFISFSPLLEEEEFCFCQFCI